MRIAIAVTTAMLAGCASTQRLPEPPKLVRVTVDRYVPLPPELTAPCDDLQAREQTYAEAKRLALVRRDIIAACNGQLARIRALQEQRP